MRSIAVRRTALAAAAAALALLSTACGGSSDNGDKAGGDKAEAGSATAAAKALTAGELEKAALTQADVKSGKVVTEVPAGDDVTKEQVKADGEACLPLAHAQAGVPGGTPAATVKRSWTGEPQKPSADTPPEKAAMAALDVPKVLVTLASYEDGGAEQALKDVEEAARKCAKGFTATVGGEKAEYTEVTGTEAPAGGDGAVALTMTVNIGEGVTPPMKVVVVRKGATLASFSAVNLASMASGQDFEFPTEIVDAQVGKLK
ncbi:hypothetical protein ACLGIH_13200 [Streptomyces sp. HMX87]|uniref:hypothetical protein n=1 Tax=Streptomyces sp. HMX87 TaxID=3390849 RepID=UPI003A8A9319